MTVNSRILNCLNSYKLGLCILLIVSFNSYAEIGEKLLSRANSGDEASQYTVGRYYELGIGVDRNYNQAFEWYSKAARSEYTDAVYRLGFFYYKGIGDIKKSPKKAFDLFLKAAEKNHSQAQEYLAEMYKKGIGVKADEERANYWYTKSFNNEFNSFNDTIEEAAAEPVKKKPVAIAKPAVKKPEPVVKKKKVTQDPNSIAGLKVNDFKNLLIKKKWKTHGTESMYFTSSRVKCRAKKTKLSCMSQKVNGVHPTGLYKYKIKTLASGFDNKGRFSATYRRLIVTVPDLSAGAYDDDDAPTIETQLKTGWENAIHRMPCKFTSKSQFICTTNAGEKLVNRASR